MSVEKRYFGDIDGQKVHLYQLSNSNGIEVKVMDFGVTITSITLPDSEKGKVDIVCGFNNLEGYFSDEFKANSPYFGAVIGRYCATIAPGKYEEFELSKNAGENTLHGGVVGFDKRMWEVSEVLDNAIVFTLNSEDGDQGFPGNVVAVVTISLNNDNELNFHYEAATNKRTPLSMTNHTYFNLSGFEENVENHVVTINSNETFSMSAKGTYDQNRSAVEGTDVDLRSAKRIADVHEALGDGFEHFFLFEGGEVESQRKVIEVEYPAKGRKLEVFTTEPGSLFYTAKYTSDKLHRESGEQYGKFRAFCCETHRVPNGPNLEGAPHIFLNEGEKFDSQTTFRFTI